MVASSGKGTGTASGWLGTAPSGLTPVLGNALGLEVAVQALSTSTTMVTPTTEGPTSS